MAVDLTKLKEGLGNVGSLIPILGAAFRKDETKSEYDVAVTAIGAVIALPDIPPMVKGIVVGAVAIVYMVTRTSRKNAETKAAG